MLLDARLVKTIVQVGWLIFLFYWVIRAFGNKKTVHRQTIRSQLLCLAVIAVFIALIQSVRRFQIALAPTIVTQVAGMMLLLIGLAIAIWARTVLGRNWSGQVTLKQEHELIRRGPYAYVRHPIYSGIILAALGTVLATDPTLLGMLCLLCLFVVLRLKSLVEERVMLQNFPDQYLKYRCEVKALIPFIY